MTVPLEGGLVSVPLTMGDDGAATRATIVDLYAAHYRPLLKLASLLLDERTTCEEVVQDAFLAVIRRGLDSVDGSKTPAYLRSAVLNGARSHLRRRVVRDRVRPLRPVASGTVGSPEARAEQRDDERAVLESLKTLPARQREVLVLRYWMELSEAEIADTLGISAGSVKTHAHRGLHALATILEERR
jgi:RNA polymerase sigma-70 factor (sigma-E family)